MPEFRVAHVSDGTHVAEQISKKFGSDRYKLSVELMDLQRRLPPSTRSSSPTPVSGSSKFSTVSHSALCSLSTTVDICVLLLTPAMMKYLNGLLDEERASLIKLVTSEQSPVALSFCVPHMEAVNQVNITFSGSALKWRHLELYRSSESFQHCMIGLIAMLEEGQEPLPLPMLKKCQLLPDKPVLPGDTVYILLENDMIDQSEFSTLNITFQNGSQVTANQVADRLYEFEVPECNQLTASVDITAEDQFLGSEVIKYCDKRQVLASILRDIINPIEFMCQALQLDERPVKDMDRMLSDWFKCDGKTPPVSNAQKVMFDWMETLSGRQASANSAYQELPTLLHFAAKYNLCALAQCLVTQPWAPPALLVQNKDGCTPDQLAAKFGNQWLSEFLSAEKEADQSTVSSSEDNYDVYEEPEYCTPNDIFTKFRDQEQAVLVEAGHGSVIASRQRHTATGLPESPKDNALERATLSKSCPPVYNTEPVYYNIDNTKEMLTHLEQDENQPYHNMEDSDGQQLSNSPPVIKPRASSDSKTSETAAAPCIISSNKRALPPRSASFESTSPTTTSGVQNARTFDHVEYHSPVSSSIAVSSVTHKTNLPRSRPSKGSSVPGRSSTPPRPNRPNKFSLPLTVESHRHSDICQPPCKPNNDVTKPALPPRPSSDGSKHTKQQTPTPIKSRRYSLSSLSQSQPSVSPALISGSASLPRLNDPKGFYGQSSSIGNETSGYRNIGKTKRSATFSGTIPDQIPEVGPQDVQITIPSVPYSCRPSPPLPTTFGSQNKLTECSVASKNARRNSLEKSQAGSGDSAQIMANQTGRSGSFDSDKEVSPDYSYPLDVSGVDSVFEEESDHDSVSPSHEEVDPDEMYEDLDKIWEERIRERFRRLSSDENASQLFRRKSTLMKEDPYIDVPTLNGHSQRIASVSSSSSPSSSFSSSSSVPVSTSALSFRFSMRKTARASRDYTTKM